MIDIFKQGQALSVAPFYFKEVGDGVQGTYIGKREKDASGAYERDNFNNEIITYEVQVPEGVKNVSFTLTKKINEDMKFVKFGQIIGFKYLGKEKFMKNGKETEYKNIKVFADPKIVDNEWMAMHADGSNDSGMGATVTPKADPLAEFSKPAGMVGKPTVSVYDTDPLAEFETVESKLKKISDLAKSKLGVSDPLLVKEAVMSRTNLAFIVGNYDSIIKELEGKF